MDDDEFGDDDLGLLADNDLQQLEQTALASTQATRAGFNRLPNRPGIQTYGDTGLSRVSNVHKGGWRPPQPQGHPQPQLPRGPVKPPDPPSSDYGFDDDEDVIDLDQPSAVLQSTSILPNRARTTTPAIGNARSSRYGSKGPMDPETEAAFAAADAELGGQQPAGQWAHAPHLAPKPDDSIDVSSLQARIRELEAEQARLRQSEEEARKAALAKQGEIAIVRLNHEKAAKEFERRLSVMQKLHSDESSKQKAELEAGRKEREKMATSNRFLQHDLVQESDRSKRLPGPGKPRAPQGTETPRKNKRVALGDGFDGDDAPPLGTPGRSRDKSAEQTPKAGAKRKRPAQDSPIVSLSFSQPVREPSMEEQQPQPHRSTAPQQDASTFMQRTLNHRPFEGHPRTVEALTKYAFPSNDKESLSSILIAALTSPLAYSTSSPVLKLSRISLNLWRRCLEERYYKPVYLLLDLLKSTLQFELPNTVNQITEEAVSICVRSINLLTNASFQAATDPSYTTSEEYEEVQTNVLPYIDVDEILEFLQQLCDAASLSKEDNSRFWHTVDFTSMMLMMNKARPIPQITAALRLLAASCTETSFGCIYDETSEDGPQKQMLHEKSTMERLTSLLFEKPPPPPDEPAYTEVEILHLRSEVLVVLRALCQNEHGGLLLANDRYAIGRLIRFLEHQVHRMYNTQPAIGLEHLTGETPLHTLIAQTVNTTVRIVYHLLRAHSEVINLQQRLAVVKGGWHKFLVSMTRIAFSDRLVFEEGLEEESVEAAHQILDSVLSPEEGEAVVKAVETPRGTKGSAVEEVGNNGVDAMEEDPS
jgi:hypothetical protein